MLNKYAVLLTDSLCKHIKFSESEKEIYTYGFELLLSMISTMLLISIISLLFGKLIYTLVFIMFFFFPRLFCGGLHANTHLKCTLSTISIFIVTAFLSKSMITTNNTKIIITTFILISLFVILFFAPLNNANHPISEKTYRKNRKICIILTLIEVVLMVFLLFLTKYYDIVAFSGLSFSWVSLLIILEKIRERRNGFGNN